MIQRKWIFFQVVAALLIAVSLLLLAVFVMAEYKAAKGDIYVPNSDKWIFPFMILMVLIVIFFMSLSLFFVRSKYPAGEISRSHHAIFLMLFIAYFLPILSLTFVFSFGYSETVSRYERGFDVTNDVWVLFAVFLAVVAMIYTMVMSFKIKKMIRRNYTEQQIMNISNFGIKEDLL